MNSELCVLLRPFACPFEKNNEKDAQKDREKDAVNWAILPWLCKSLRQYLSD